jgi:hypothetical protein
MRSSASGLIGPQGGCCAGGFRTRGPAAPRSRSRRSRPPAGGYGRSRLRKSCRRRRPSRPPLNVTVAVVGAPSSQLTTIFTVVAGRDPLKNRTSPVIVALHRPPGHDGLSTIQEWLYTSGPKPGGKGLKTRWLAFFAVLAGWPALRPTHAEARVPLLSLIAYGIAGLLAAAVHPGHFESVRLPRPKGVGLRSNRP